VFVNEVPELIVNKPVKVFVPAVVTSFIEDVPFKVVVPVVLKLEAFKLIAPVPFTIVLPLTFIVAAPVEPVNVPATIKLPVTVIVPVAAAEFKVPLMVKSPLTVIEFAPLNVKVPPELMVKFATLMAVVFNVMLCPVLMITLVPIAFGTTAGDQEPAVFQGPVTKLFVWLKPMVDNVIVIAIKNDLKNHWLLKFTLNLRKMPIVVAVDSILKFVR